MTELLPCPFCGGQPIEGGQEQKLWTICCENDDCMVMPSVDSTARERAKAEWNTRADKSPSPEAERLAKALRECLDAAEYFRKQSGQTVPAYGEIRAQQALAEFEKGG